MVYAQKFFANFRAGLKLQRVYNSLLLPRAKLFSCLQFIMTFPLLQGYYYSLQLRSYTPDLLYQPKVNMKQFGPVPEMKKGKFPIRRSKERDRKS